MTDNPIDGATICLSCAALPNYCNSTVAGSPSSIRRLKNPPRCPIDFAIWCGLWASNGGLKQAEKIATIVMRPDDPRTYYWFLRAVWQVADRMGLLRPTLAKRAREVSKYAKNISASYATEPRIVAASGTRNEAGI